MANTQAMCTSFMSELMTATNNFGTAPTRGTSAADTFKAALYLTTATVDASTTAYSATNEVSGTNYTAGGVNVGSWNAPTPTNSSATAGTAFTTPAASITYGTSGSPVTLSTAFNAVLIFNNTQGSSGNRPAVSVHTFGSQTITAGVFTLTMPPNTTSAALLRLATT